MEPVLAEQAVEVLVSGKYAEYVARERSTRLAYVLEIASLYTKSELLRRPGLKRSTVLRIEEWLKYHGGRFRRADESIDSVICGFDVHRWRRKSRKPRVALVRRLPRLRLVRPHGTIDQIRY